MTPEQFVFWLSGLLSMYCKDSLAAPNHYIGIIQKIENGLKTVKNDKIQSMIFLETQ